MTLKSLLNEATVILKKNNIESAGLDAKLLFTDHLNLELHELITREDLEVSIADQEQLNKKIQRRSVGEPVAYIVGYKYFYKSKFLVNKSVLIPRPETELLAEEALKWCSGKENIKILDMGVGSGCLGQSVLKELGAASLVAMDISKDALEVAKINCEKLGLSGKVDFILGDIKDLSIEKYTNQFDLILANPPYIDPEGGFVEENVKKYEPSIALFSNHHGLEDIISWTERAASWLKPSGLYLMEFGDKQSEKVEELFKQTNFFMDLSLHKDYSGLPRFMKAINKTGE